tara:strand:- start:161 stop:523 length:363 start_codon:yes stop_codon:yes gene_type:complete
MALTEVIQVRSVTVLQEVELERVTRTEAGLLLLLAEMVVLAVAECGQGMTERAEEEQEMRGRIVHQRVTMEVSLPVGIMVVAVVGQAARELIALAELEEGERVRLILLAEAPLLMPPVVM